MLKLNKITYQYQTGENTILDEINIQIKENELILICGESGSGKTTLIDIISGLIKEQKGSITWKSKVVSDRDRRWLCACVNNYMMSAILRYLDQGLAPCTPLRAMMNAH